MYLTENVFVKHKLAAPFQLISRTRVTFGLMSSFFKLANIWFHDTQRSWVTWHNAVTASGQLSAWKDFWSILNLTKLCSLSMVDMTTAGRSQNSHVLISIWKAACRSASIPEVRLLEQWVVDVEDLCQIGGCVTCTGYQDIVEIVLLGRSWTGQSCQLCKCSTRHQIFRIKLCWHWI